MANRPDPVAPHERRTRSAGDLPFLPSAQPESEEFASIQAAAMERYRPRDVKREPPRFHSLGTKVAGCWHSSRTKVSASPPHLRAARQKARVRQSRQSRRVLLIQTPKAVGVAARSRTKVVDQRNLDVALRHPSQAATEPQSIDRAGVAESQRKTGGAFRCPTYAMSATLPSLLRRKGHTAGKWDRLRQDLLDQQERQMADLRALIERTTAAAHSNRADYPLSEPRAEVPQPRWPHTLCEEFRRGGRVTALKPFLSRRDRNGTGACAKTRGRREQPTGRTRSG